MDIVKVAIGAAILAGIWPATTYYPGPIGIVLSVVLLVIGIKLLLDGLDVHL